MALVVQKFGGTSVGSPERIKKVAARIAHEVSRGSQVVVVVSAMGDTTDDLIELAHQVSEKPSHREMDMLLTAGERISMALTSMALADLKVAAVSFTGSQSGIITDGSHRRAKILRILGNRVRETLAQGKVAIVAGFQGVSEAKEITTLGRGGSDTSAVALASVLDASRCDIFTDVDGVYSADPRVVKSPRFWPEIPASLMTEMAVLGAAVLHPRSVQLAGQKGVPLWVKNSLKPIGEDSGTLITSDRPSRNALGPNSKDKEADMEKFSVVAVASDMTKGWMSVKLARPTVLNAVWDVSAKKNLSIVAPQFQQGILNFFGEVESQGDWKAEFEKLGRDGFIESYEFNESWVPVSVVGHRFSQDGQALGEIFDTLASAGVTAQLGNASSLSATVAVPRSHAQDAVKALHERFLGKS